MAEKTTEAANRDVEQNFNGDAKKAGAMKRFEETGTATHVYLELDDEGQKVANAAFAEDRVKFDGLLVNAGKRFDHGKITACGTKDGKPLVKGDAALTTILVEDVREWRRTRVITAAEAAGELNRARRSVTFHKEKNPRADFLAVDAIMKKVEAAYRKVAFAETPEDCRSIVETLEQADIESMCRKATIDNKVAHVRDLAGSVGLKDEVEREIANAVTMPEFKDQVNALGITIKKLYGLDAKTSERRQAETNQENEERARQHHFPSTRRGDGRGTHGGGRTFRGR